MGLCKCRSVTNLFCFEHRKNVCEKCILSDHPNCVVQSYLAWLQDSDYEAVCKLCKKGLDVSIVRLTCLDLFHVDCINQYCFKLPEHTASAGYACPSCNTPIIPPDNVNTRIADVVRNTFRDAPWAHHIIPSRRVTPAPQDPRLEATLNPTSLSNTNNTTTSFIQATLAPPTSFLSRNLLASPTAADGSSNTMMSGLPPTGSRKPLGKFMTTRKNSVARDVDDDKYLRKDSQSWMSSLTIFGTLLTIRRFVFLVVVCLVVIYVGSALFSETHKSDPFDGDTDKE
ncbi:hypothetical protein SeMB42_g06588 [Synchytrium endobioticum]|uniref:RING-type domain-containing protein n=1 Tax=Synchytrium endobioticum TaxID=286115 RepID=A0A507CK25_9FUNG|nr:hypothetical protein SeMB42_g06588 [Synchytrium endobioticum]TPX41177.1 hypothetical protein SeLEV6574_g06220 [Synchytrium endobioticum]